MQSKQQKICQKYYIPPNHDVELSFDGSDGAYVNKFDNNLSNVCGTVHPSVLRALPQCHQITRIRNEE